MKKLVIVGMMLLAICISSISMAFDKPNEFQREQYTKCDPEWYYPKEVKFVLDGKQLNLQNCIGPGLLPVGVAEYRVIGRQVNGKQRVEPFPVVVVAKTPPSPSPKVEPVPLPPKKVEPVEPKAEPKPIPTPIPPVVKPKQVPVVKPKQVPVVFETIYFDLSKSAITPQASKILDRSGKVLKDNPKVKVEIGGHTDSTGSAANKVISEKRANSAKQYLKDKFNIPESQLKTKGYGSAKPIADNATAEGRSKNRRVEFCTID